VKQPLLTRRELVAGLSALGLGAIARRAGAREETDVIVLGAGLAGLYAATLLEELGVRTLVLEASDRVGGRLHTLDHLAGAPECGGQTLDAMYSRTLSLVQRLGLSTFERPRRGPATYAVGGAVFTADEWSTHRANPLRGAERAILPNRLYGHYLDRLNPLENLYDWRKPEFLRHDRRSVGQAVADAGASPEAMRFMDRWFDGAGLEAMSALFAYRKQRVAEFGRQAHYRISGGSARLPEAMAAALGQAPRLGHRVIGLRSGPDRVEVDCADGRRFAARYALVSVPFSVVRTWAVEPAMPPDLRMAVDRMPYNPITQVKVAFDAPFWEADGLPPNA
jgi:monoamine oxidase